MKFPVSLFLCAIVYLNSQPAIADEKSTDANRERTEILKKWQAASEKVEFLDVTVKIIEYNNTFLTE